MIRRRVRRTQHPLGDPRPGQTHAYEMKVGNRWLHHGDNVKVRGRRGAFRFIRLEECADHEPVVSLWDAGGAWRAVRPDVLKIAPKRRTTRKGV